MSLSSGRGASSDELGELEALLLEELGVPPPALPSSAVQPGAFLAAGAACGHHVGAEPRPKVVETLADLLLQRDTPPAMRISRMRSLLECRPAQPAECGAGPTQQAAYSLHTDSTSAGVAAPQWQAAGASALAADGRMLSMSPSPPGHGALLSNSKSLASLNSSSCMQPVAHSPREQQAAMQPQQAAMQMQQPAWQPVSWQPQPDIAMQQVLAQPQHQAAMQSQQWLQQQPAEQDQQQQALEQQVLVQQDWPERCSAGRQPGGKASSTQPPQGKQAAGTAHSEARRLYEQRRRMRVRRTWRRRDGWRAGSPAAPRCRRARAACACKAHACGCRWRARLADPCAGCLRWLRDAARAHARTGQVGELEAQVAALEAQVASLAATKEQLLARERCLEEALAQRERLVTGMLEHKVRTHLVLGVCDRMPCCTRDRRRRACERAGARHHAHSTPTSASACFAGCLLLAPCVLQHNADKQQEGSGQQQQQQLGSDPACGGAGVLPAPLLGTRGYAPEAWRQSHIPTVAGPMKVGSQGARSNTAGADALPPLLLPDMSAANQRCPAAHAAKLIALLQRTPHHALRRRALASAPCLSQCSSVRWSRAPRCASQRPACCINNSGRRPQPHMHAWRRMRAAAA